MNNSSLVTIASFSFPYEANLAKASLEAAGIPAFVADEHTINMQWLYSHAMGGVRVQVPRAFAEEAYLLLQADFSDSVADKEELRVPTCPACGSSNCQTGSKNRVPAFLVFFLFGIPLLFSQYGIQCDDCGSFTKR